MVFNKIKYLCFIVLLLASCAGKQKNITNQDITDTISFNHAKLLKIEKANNYYVATIHNPWCKGELHRYLLIKEENDIKTIKNKYQDAIPTSIIKIPLKKAVIGTAVHASIISELEALNQVKGICDVQYIMSKEIEELILKEQIHNIGNSHQPDIEKMLSIECDGLFISPYKKSNFSIIEKAGIPVIECADYMELSALGRAEWIKFYGLLMGKQHRADSIFNIVEKNYIKLKRLAATQTLHPLLLNDLKMGNVWYMPGGKSTMSELFADAGANYPFKNKGKSGSQNLSFEQVFMKAHDADVWIIKYGKSIDYTYDLLKQEFAPYAEIKAFKQRCIYGCNTFKVPFFEQEPFHPDKMLNDLIKILYPDLLYDKPFYFFKPLK